MTNQTIEQAVEEAKEILRKVSIREMYRPDAEARLTKALQAQRDAGRQEVYSEMEHEQKKLLDGFSHPKDCSMCLTHPTK